MRDTNEAAKELSNFYNRLLLKNTPGITFMLDLNMNFILGSERTVSLLGYADMREMVGYSFSTLFAGTMTGEWIAATEARCRNVMDSREAEDYQEKAALRNGEGMVFQIIISPAAEQDGSCRGVVVVMNDVTELSRAREAALMASEAKGAFLANMSHEMRTPMNAIIGMTAIARNAEDPERKDYCLKKIEDASSHLLGVINDILDMSKIEANKLELSYVDFDFERMIRKVVNVINFRVEERKQNFTVAIGERIPQFLTGDDQRLAQVITNLLSNAVKFTPEGGSIALAAKLIEEEQDRCVIQIEVTDTGIGISPEQQSRLFTSFEQAESGTSRKFGGTGLGLAISKRIVDMMGGRIWIESELGKGSTFAFTVQAGKGQGESQGPEIPAAAGEENRQEKADRFDGFSILLAEDVDINREIVLALLEPTGLSIECAENGKAAVAMFLAGPDKYDMIFMDVQMPEMDGYEATRRIRAFEEERRKESAEHRQRVPIVAMTANVFREDVEKCLAAGMNDHVGKPLELTDVLAKLRNYLPVQNAEIL
ncbi:MAG: response regulator [Treponema sp.]|nr:response regulator [Treponema sp.]